MKIKIFTTDTTETVFYLYRKDETRELHVALERIVNNISRVSREEWYGHPGRAFRHIDCILL